MKLINADCLAIDLPHVDTIFADPPDGIGLKYATYKDTSAGYHGLLQEWVHHFVTRARTVWISFNSRWVFEMGRIVTGLGIEIESKLCVQTFTFGQHNQFDLGNNFRPLLRLRWPDAPLYPDAIRVPSWRQLNGDKRADPRGRVPGDVAEFELCERDTLPLPNWSPSDIERFLAKIDKKGENDCWEWTACKREGYGRIHLGDHLYVATRLMWRLTHGTDPIGQIICHSCDNPGCCNPSHLFIGTDEDNNSDKETKRRGKHPFGEHNGLAKLSDEDVTHIFQSYDTSACLAAEYGVTGTNIDSIRTGKTWRHITDKLLLSDVFNIPRVTGNSKQRRAWHPTQLHESLVERCLKLTTPPGGTVLDPFGGTGTTLRVCKRLGFDCTLVEIDPTYCAKIEEEHGV